MAKTQKNSRFAQVRRKFWEKMTPLRLLAIGGGLIIVVVSIIIGLSQPAPDPLTLLSLDAIEARGVLRVGSRGDANGFSLRGASAEDWTGLETDIARELSTLVLDAPDKVEFIETPFTARNFNLTEGTVDCIIGLSPRGYSTAMIYSEPYYTDSVVLAVRMDGAVTLEELQGSGGGGGAAARVAALTRQPQSRNTTNPIAHQGALTVLTNYNANNNAGLEVVQYAGAQDMFRDLLRGGVDAVAMESALLPKYFNAQEMRVLGKAVGTVDYSVAALPENQSLIDAANIVLAEMRQSGRLAALYDAYDLRDYSQLR